MTYEEQRIDILINYVFRLSKIIECYQSLTEHLLSENDTYPVLNEHTNLNDFEKKCKMILHKKVVREAMRRADGKRTEASRMLNVSRATLRNWSGDE